MNAPIMSEKRRIRSRVVLLLTTGVQLTLYAMFVLACAIMLGVLAKLIMRALQFGWNLWA